MRSTSPLISVDDEIEKAEVKRETIDVQPGG